METITKRMAIGNNLVSLADIQHNLMLLDINCCLEELELNNEFKIIQENLFKINKKIKQELEFMSLKDCDYCQDEGEKT